VVSPGQTAVLPYLAEIRAGGEIHPCLIEKTRRYSA